MADSTNSPGADVMQFMTTLNIQTWLDLISLMMDDDDLDLWYYSSVGCGL